MPRRTQTEPESASDPVFLVVSEVAKILRYDEETVRAKYRNGTLPGKKIGGKWLALKHQIEELAGVRLTRDPTAGWIVTDQPAG